MMHTKMLTDRALHQSLFLLRSKEVKKKLRLWQRVHAKISFLRYRRPMLPTLETKRLILRPLKISDAEAIYAYARDPIVSKYTLWEPHQNLSDAKNFIEHYAFPKYAENTPEPFGLCLKSDPQTVIGTSGCFWVSKDNHIMELGYALNPKFWGQGFIVEASRCIIDFVFRNYQVMRLQCRCKSEHFASERIMQKLHMNFEGILQKAVFHRETYWDMKYYSLISRN